MKTHASNSRRIRLVKTTGFTCAILAFGLLLWARFIIVTGHPRTAVADPVVQQQVQAKAEPRTATVLSDADLPNAGAAE